MALSEKRARSLKATNIPKVTKTGVLLRQRYWHPDKMVQNFLKMKNRALKSPQKFRTPGYSSANFLGSWYISGLKSKSYYKIWTLWSQIGLQMVQFHSFLIMKCYKIETYHVIFKHCVQEMIILLESLKSFRKVQISFLRCSITTKAPFIKGKMI